MALLTSDMLSDGMALVRFCRELQRGIFMHRSTIRRSRFIKITVVGAMAAVLAHFEVRAGDSVPPYLTIRVSTGVGKLTHIKTIRFDEIDNELDHCLESVGAECIRIGAAFGGELYKDRMLLELSSNGYQVATFAVRESYVKLHREDIARTAYRYALAEARARYEHYCAFGDLPYRIDDKSRLIKAL